MGLALARGTTNSVNPFVDLISNGKENNNEMIDLSQAYIPDTISIQDTQGLSGNIITFIDTM